MKAIRTVFILIFSTVALSGCLKDNRDDCPEGADCNLVLHFEYMDEEGTDIFADRIEMVDLVLFDRSYRFYAWFPLSKEDLEEFRGAQVTVEPGDYHVVCWANVSSSRDEIPGDESTSFEDALLHHSNSATADPLHYAPDKRETTINRSTRGGLTDEGLWMVSVASAGVTEDTIGFMSAHRTVKVYMKDFPEMNEPQPVYPMVTMERLAEYYDFSLGRGPEKANFVQTSYEVKVKDERYSYAQFYIPHFDNDNNVELVIRGRAPYDYYTFYVSMAEILELHEIDSVYDGDDIVLEVEIIWEGTYIQVQLPSFSSMDVEPGFN